MVSRKRPLPCAPCVWNPIGYSGSIFLINPGGVPVVTSASNPARRCACVENMPVISAMRETMPILNDGWVSIIKKLARPHGLSREFIQPGSYPKHAKCRRGDRAHREIASQSPPRSRNVNVDDEHPKASRRKSTDEDTTIAGSEHERGDKSPGIHCEKKTD